VDIVRSDGWRSGRALVSNQDEQREQSKSALPMSERTFPEYEERHRSSPRVAARAHVENEGSVPLVRKQTCTQMLLATSHICKEKSAVRESVQFTVAGNIHAALGFFRGKEIIRQLSLKASMQTPLWRKSLSKLFKAG